MAPDDDKYTQISKDEHTKIAVAISDIEVHLGYIKGGMDKIVGSLKKQDERLDKHDVEIAVTKVKSGWIAAIVSLIGGIIAVATSILIRRGG